MPTFRGLPDDDDQAFDELDLLDPDFDLSPGPRRFSLWVVVCAWVVLAGLAVFALTYAL